MNLYQHEMKLTWENVLLSCAHRLSICQDERIVTRLLHIRFYDSEYVAIFAFHVDVSNKILKFYDVLESIHYCVTNMRQQYHPIFLDMSKTEHDDTHKPYYPSSEVIEVAIWSTLCKWASYAVSSSQIRFNRDVVETIVNIPSEANEIRRNEMNPNVLHPVVEMLYREKGAPPMFTDRFSTDPEPTLAQRIFLAGD